MKAGKRHSTVMCLAPRSSHLALLLALTGQGGFAVRQEALVELGLNLLTDAPELISRKLRNQLDTLQVSERNVLFLVPGCWLLNLRVTLPDVAEEDLEGLLRLEAERGFSYPPEELVVTESRYRTADNAAGALLVAVLRERLNRVREILTGAGLRLRGFLPEVTALAPPATAEGRMNLLVRDDGIDLAAWHSGGLLAIREIAAVPSIIPPLPLSALASDCSRELRLLSGQLSPLAWPEAVVAGRRDLADFNTALGAELGPATTVAAGPGPGHESNYPALAAAAAMYLQGMALPLDFTAQRLTLDQANRRLRRRRLLLYTAAGVLLVVGVGGGLFLNQRLTLNRLRRQYAQIHQEAVETQDLRDRVKALAPWFRQQPAALEVLYQVTSAFPESGSVWATRIEVRDANQVFLSGKARSEQELLQMQARLREHQNVRNLRLLQVRDGKDQREPLTFSLSFNFTPGN